MHDFVVAGTVAICFFLVVLMLLQLGRKAVLAGFLVLFLFSNPLISIFSVFLSQKLELTVLQGLDFAFSMMVLGWVWMRKSLTVPEVSSGIMSNTWIFIFLIFSYYAIGIVNNGFVDASIYFRMFIYPIALMFIGAWLGGRLDFSTFERLFIFCALIFVAATVFEFFWPHAYYRLLNADSYYALKQGDPSLNMAALIDSRYRRLLNLRMLEDIKVYRPAGLTFNYPSTAYVFVTAFTVALAARKYWTLPFWLLGIGLLGAKAGIVSVLFVLIAWFVFATGVRIGWKGWSAIGVAYAVAVVWFMFDSLSVHTHSLVSSVLNIPSNLFGKGLGYGGAMTVEREITWEYDMLVGDSGVAIGLNMLGIAVLYVYVYYLVKMARLLRVGVRLRDRRLYLFAVLGIVAIFNSVIQELAIGPYAVGMALFISYYYAAATSHVAPEIIAWRSRLS